MKKNSAEVNRGAEHMRVAQENDAAFRVKSAQSLRIQQERSENHMLRVRAEETKRIEESRLKRAMLEFKSEQKKRLANEERDKKAGLLKIQLEKLNAFKDIQNSINFQRPNALKQVFRGSFDGNSKPPSVTQASPGPGEYDLQLKKKTIGGYMSNKTAAVELKTVTPGPGAYEPDGSTASMISMKRNTGTLPFRGRGKSDVDWLVLEAKQRPGPGYYNLSAPKKSGGKFGSASLKSDLDARIAYKRDIPGPGAYEIDPGLKKQITLNTIAKKNAVSDHLSAPQYSDLLECYK